ncbi:MAG: hypothetical protein ACRC1R_04960 [Cetobacterium sp.]|uniref:hypothetical protein n=1 Tax=Cetobacterium sp. TaxID=2071632 RepID=UPI003F3AC259
MGKKIFLILIMWIVGISKVYAFEFSPIGFDKRIDGGQGYGEFYLDNSTNNTQRYKVKIKSTGKENDVSKYMKIYPSILTVEPKGRGVIKVYGEVPRNFQEGIYRFLLATESVPMPSLKKHGNDVNGGVSMRTNVAVEMEAYVGEVRDDIKNLNKKIIEKNGERYFQGEFINNSPRGYEIGVGFVDGDDSLIEVYSQGRLKGRGKMEVYLKIPRRSKKVIFYDYNNQVFLKDSVKL